MEMLVIHPDDHREFGSGGGMFVVVTTQPYEDVIRIDPCATPREVRVLCLEENEPLGAVFVEDRCPDGADVLVICPGLLIKSPDERQIASRRVAVVPCGSTPATDADLAYFLSVVEANDPAELAASCDRIFESFERCDEVVLSDEVSGARATFVPREDYEWNQQAGILQPGEQTIVPGGEASALPVDIFEFDRSRRLSLDGTLSLHGTPIVHRGENTPAGLQSVLFDRLRPVLRSPVFLDLRDGTVEDVRPGNDDARPAAAALEELFDANPDYRILWEVGIGVNTRIRPRRSNCGMNEVHGSGAGTLHVGFGLTPTTEVALTFTCADTILSEPTGAWICGGSDRSAGRRRITVRRSASCGCS